ncbi:hypothetical protein [Cryobacterium sp. TMT2-14]|uniref:mechanosensitive ion channel family protein n=1 Tax=Cryobacterium sp. TMT2-14 TaxID=1259245 RepID=UPI0018E0C148|nr:hypothetical protein [Cryobacterium sp. TMT2-14]
MLFVLQFAFGVFGPNPVSDLLAGIIAFLPKIIVAIIIVIAAAVAAGVKTLIQGALGGPIKPPQARWESYLVKPRKEPRR